MQTHPSSKPSAAWATDLIDRWRGNLFLKTATYVVGLQLALALLTIVLFVWGVGFVQDRTISAIGERIIQGIFNDTPASNESIAEAVLAVSWETYFVLASVLILLNVIFGYLIARFALWPTRNSLQFQKRFIGNIAHEIRTPLAIIKTNTEVALFDPALPENVKETFTDTLAELDRISETINNLLSFDTLTRPRRMTMEPTDVGDIAETALARHQALATSRNVTLESSIEGSRMVHGNAVALEQVVTNLVKNAINYTPKDKRGTVSVCVGPGETSGTVKVTVRDTGIGIEQKDLFHIFEPFYRADTSRARGVGTGTSGLGLAIVNEIVRLHKGAISIRSTPGVGTEISVTLPAAKNGDLPDPLSDGTQGPNEVSFNFS
ncbi:MAG TPA: HAMP domain-containing sensor histidine kinase [Candidatus Paceibacterota bacterium]